MKKKEKIMKYIFIVGSGYKDCKKTLDNIEKDNNVNYAFVTKLKHMQGIPAEEMIETEAAKNNPNYKKIVAKFKKRNKGVPIKKKETPKPEPISDEFKEELDELIEKDEDVKEEPTEIKLGEELGFDPQPVVNEELNNELPEEESTVDEPFDSTDVDDIPSIDDVSDPYDVTIHSEITPEPEEEIEVEGLDVLEEREMEDDKADEDLPESTPEEEGEEIKPVNAPRGWHLRNEFIDEVGNIFHKGEYVGRLSDE